MLIMGVINVMVNSNLCFISNLPNCDLDKKLSYRRDSLDQPLLVIT